jgi:hypothetical protein
MGTSEDVSLDEWIAFTKEMGPDWKYAGVVQRVPGQMAVLDSALIWYEGNKASALEIVTLVPNKLFNFKTLISIVEFKRRVELSSILKRWLALQTRRNKNAICVDVPKERMVEFRNLMADYGFLIIPNKENDSAN